MNEPAQRFFEAERLRADGALTPAEAAYRAVLDAQPRHAGALEGLASIHDLADQPSQAAACRSRAAAIRAEATTEVAAALLFRGDTKRARECCERALGFDADCLKAHWLMGDISERGGDREAALAHYRRCSEIAPERLGPGFLMAALGEGAPPTRAPADYVTAQFDWYAETFDGHLVDTLLYRGPEEVARALRIEFADSAPTILDLGCGTGLLAPEVNGFSGRLIGVDLSPAMLEKAALRGGYEALVTGDIGDFLEARPAGGADVAAAVDVVVYLGDLAPLFAGVAHALRPGGVFVFTTERWDEEDAQDPPADRGWRLRASGRYQHARAEVHRLAQLHGFAVERIEDRVLRYELGLPVDSDLAVLRRRA